MNLSNQKNLIKLRGKKKKIINNMSLVQMFVEHEWFQLEFDCAVNGEINVLLWKAALFAG